MAITRWDPMQEMFPLRDAMDRLFDATHVRPDALLSVPSALPLDVYADGDTYVVEAALPGLSPDVVSVEVLGNQVTISGEYPAAPQDRQYLIRERPAGRFRRTLTLPTDVDADKTEGRFEHGLLRLTAPKAEHARPKQLALTAS